MNERLHIAFIVGSLVQGGAERQLYYMLQALSEADVDLRLLCTTQGEYWEEPIRKLGLSITWLGNNRTRVGRLLRIFNILRNEPPDVIQSSHSFTNLYTALTARALNARGIGAVRGPISLGYHAIGDLAGYFSLRLPHVLAINSEAALVDARRRGIADRKLFYLPNVVDASYYQPCRIEASEQLLVVAVGRLVWQKRFERFIELIAHMRDRTNGRVRGALIGDGPQIESLRRSAADLGLGENAFEFSGAVANVEEVYAKADVLVLTSDDEGTPNVVLEAMAAGLPVIATDVGDVGRLIRHEDTGFILNPWSANMAVDILERLCDDEDLRRRVGRRAREYILARRSHLRLSSQLSDLYSFAMRRPVQLHSGSTVRHRAHGPDLC